MSSGTDVRRIALALPEAYEDVHRRRPAFRVGGKIFATLGVQGSAQAEGFYAPLAGARPVASVTIDREDQLNLAAAYPDAIVAAGPYGYSFVWLDTVDPGLLEQLIRMSWAKVAPKRLPR